MTQTIDSNRLYDLYYAAKNIIDYGSKLDDGKYCSSPALDNAVDAIRRSLENMSTYTPQQLIDAVDKMEKDNGVWTLGAIHPTEISNLVKYLRARPIAPELQVVLNELLRLSKDRFFEIDIAGKEVCDKVWPLFRMASDALEIDITGKEVCDKPLFRMASDALETHPCEKCGAPRTKAEGGKLFLLCDACWDKEHPKDAKVPPSTGVLMDDVRTVTLKPLPRVGVAILVTRASPTGQGTELLMGKRLSKAGEGTWSIPGGALEPGEKPHDAAFRELWEETLLRTKWVLQPYKRLPWGWADVGGQQWVTLYFHADWEYLAGPRTPVTTEPEKCAGWEWVPTHRLPEPLFPPFASLLGHLP